MLAEDRDALVCDLAETYHVLDMAALPVPLLATLAAGLREDSRIRMKMAGERERVSTILQAAMLDRLTTLCWMQTRDGARGRNRPSSVFDAMAGKEKEKCKPTVRPTAYDSPEDFDHAWAEFSQTNAR